MNKGRQKFYSEYRNVRSGVRQWLFLSLKSPLPLLTLACRKSNSIEALHLNQKNWRWSIQVWRWQRPWHSRKLSISDRLRKKSCSPRKTNNFWQSHRDKPPCSNCWKETPSEKWNKHWVLLNSSRKNHSVLVLVNQGSGVSRPSVLSRWRPIWLHSHVP